MEYFMSHLLGVKGVSWGEDWKSIKLLQFSNEKLESYCFVWPFGLCWSWKEIRNLTLLFSTSLAHFSCSNPTFPLGCFSNTCAKVMILLSLAKEQTGHYTSSIPPDMGMVAALAFDDTDAVAELYTHFIAPWICLQETNSAYIKKTYRS